MIVDCERCPGQHLTPPACPSCVVRLLLEVAPARPPGPRADLARPTAERPVEVDLVRRTDDLGRELDTRERRAVAVLTAAGLLATPGGGRADGHGAGVRRAPGRGGRFRTA